MNKQILLILVFCAVNFNAVWAQDTTAYKIQRAKVNSLLVKRSAKFGAYDKSLNARTGIFGLQTKRDIKNSNEILRDIALTDNNIFKELKILLDYNNLQMDQAKSTVDYNKGSILNYRKTIKDLQQQQKDLKDQLKKSQNSSLLAHLFMFIFLTGCLILAYFLKQQMKLNKSNEKASI